jgi:hypothetical protein
MLRRDRLLLGQTAAAVLVGLGDGVPAPVARAAPAGPPRGTGTPRPTRSDLRRDLGAGDRDRTGMTGLEDRLAHSGR